MFVFIDKGSWDVVAYRGTWWRIVGRGGALVEAITLNRRVVGSTPALPVT